MARILRFQFFVFSLIFVTVWVGPAIASCGQSNGSIFATAKCNKEPVRLNDLFKWKEEFIGKRVEHTALQFAPRKTSRGNLRRYRVKPDFPKTDTLSTTKPVLLRSTNKRLSEFGHQKAAEILVSCIQNQMFVELHFPGYPMSESARPVNVAYQVNAGAPWTMTFEPTRDLFKVEISGTTSVDLFLASIKSGDYLDVVARDIEDTLITANFDIRSASDDLHKLQKNCFA